MAEDERDGEASASQHLPLIVGLLFGVVLSSITGQWWWLAIGVALGAATGAGIERARQGRRDDD